MFQEDGSQIHDFHILKKGINSIGEKSLQIKKKKKLYFEA